ncbi:MAG: DUF1304 family protein [Planctomycetes bacterium]|nr:DUF1304 family protein [Planctomycetota bacterium]
MVSHVAKALVFLVALVQIGIAVIEIFFWEVPFVHSRLGFSADEAHKVAPIVANAGLYNSFLAAGLIWGLFAGAKGFHIKTFFLICVIVAGVFGAVTLKPTTLILQTAPGGLALLAVWISRHAAEPRAATGRGRTMGTSAAVVFLGAILTTSASGEDVSPPPILQWFEGKYETMIRRTPDAFLAGYGAVWIPPPGRAGREGDGGFSVGYDPYDRFDLGRNGHRTKYGTEEGIKQFAAMLHRAGIDLHIDFIINHNGTRHGGEPDFVKAGDYPGFVVTLPHDVDGDFHNGFLNADDDPLNGRLFGAVDIAHDKNHLFIRSPVPGFANNIPAGTTRAFGRLADQPDANNRRFYPDRDSQPILLFDPKTGQGGIQVFPFNTDDPMAGDPVEENAMGYLMRNARWLVQDIGADGFRIDATKHVPLFALEFFDRAIYRSSPRRLLDGSQKQVFCYCEPKGVDRQQIITYVRKDINPSDAGRIGGNRDTLDFNLFFRMVDHLSSNGLANDWRTINAASVDVDDDGLRNGSAGVKFVSSHDDFGPALDNVAHAYVLMLPGNAIVYFNAGEHGQDDFPKAGRGDALGGSFGDRIVKLVGIRNSHGRGNYKERLLTKELLAFEREGSAVVLLNNRRDSGFDEVTVATSFAPGTPLIELTGNASDAQIDANDKVPELVVVNSDRTINVRVPRNNAPGGQAHNSGYLIYGLAAPQAPAGIELTGVDRVEPAETPTAQTNGAARLSPLHVIKGDSFEVKIKTVEVNLVGNHRDLFADGDNALLSIDDGRDVTGDGRVDFRKPGSVTYGFERFRDKSSPRIGTGGINGPRGDGEFVQTIDATKLENGVHFLEVRAFRHRTDGGPAIYSSFKKVLLVERP